MVWNQIQSTQEHKHHQKTQRQSLLIILHLIKQSFFRIEPVRDLHYPPAHVAVACMSCCDNKGILITLKLSARSSNWWNSPLIHNSSWSGNDSQLPETLEGRKKDYFHRLWSEKKLRLRSKPERRHQKPRSYIKGMSAHAIKRGEESPWTGISNICSQRYVGQSDSCGLNMSHSIFRDLVMREVSACGACNRLWTSPSRLIAHMI